MKKFLKFTLDSDATNAADQIYYNMLIEAATAGDGNVGEGDTDKTLAQIQAMTQSDAVANLRIYGRCAVNNMVLKNNTGTNKYANPQKATNDNIWWFSSPDESLMTGVVNYTEIDVLDPWWFSMLVTSLTRIGTVATAISDNLGDLAPGMDIEVSGAIETQFNGTFTLDTVVYPDTFTYTVSGSPSTPATGTILFITV